MYEQKSYQEEAVDHGMSDPGTPTPLASNVATWITAS